MDRQQVIAIISKFAVPKKKLTYGTAGFRDEWRGLHSTFQRMGMLATLRSRSRTGHAVGVMITASHNDEKDNGIKMVDIDGGMLSQDWEPIAEKMANLQSADEVVEYLDYLSREFDCVDQTLPTSIIIGRDTRPHSKELFDCVCEGASAMGGRIFDLGEVTTPQLHFVVQRMNQKDQGGCPDTFDSSTALGEYYDTLGGGFIYLQQSSSNTPVTNIVIDGAFGVGGKAITSFVSRLGCLNIDLRNQIGFGSVNAGCGAEVVQKGQISPCGINPETDANKLMCSYDGDADRIVFHCFRPQESPPWSLLDGDKIAALVSTFIVEELRAADLLTTSDDSIKMGVVQTAYANGASTAFLRAQGIEVAMAKTGVKYLHHVALE
jgi:phosphoacetylglucosamine mutase